MVCPTVRLQKNPKGNFVVYIHQPFCLSSVYVKHQINMAMQYILTGFLNVYIIVVYVAFFFLFLFLFSFSFFLNAFFFFFFIYIVCLLFGLFFVVVFRFYPD